MINDIYTPKGECRNYVWLFNANQTALVIDVVGQRCVKPVISVVYEHAQRQTIQRTETDNSAHMNRHTGVHSHK